ncbi:MAG: hypothetical protein AAGA84_00300 [Pseudomonadota bacterium]
MPQLVTLVSIATLLALGLSANAQDNKKPRRGPPAEAFEVCEGQVTEAACAFVGRRGETVEGVCVLPPRKETDKLVCKPENRPERAPRRPDDHDEGNDEDNI